MHFDSPPEVHAELAVNAPLEKWLCLSGSSGTRSKRRLLARFTVSNFARVLRKIKIYLTHKSNRYDSLCEVFICDAGAGVSKESRALVSRLLLHTVVLRVRVREQPVSVNQVKIEF